MMVPIKIVRGKVINIRYVVLDLKSHFEYDIEYEGKDGNTQRYIFEFPHPYRAKVGENIYSIYQVGYERMMKEPAYEYFLLLLRSACFGITATCAPFIPIHKFEDWHKVSVIMQALMILIFFLWTAFASLYLKAELQAIVTLKNSGIITEGKVVDNVVELGADDDVFYHPVIKYSVMTQDYLCLGTGRLKKFKFILGQEIQIIYDPIYPGYSRENSFFHLFFLICFFGLLTAVFGIVTIYQLLLTILPIT